jgi:hypothetical protein
MRSLALRALAAGVAVVLVCPVLAQQPGGRGGRGGFGGPGGGNPKLLLLNKSVQDELKLSDDQKADLQKVQEKQMAAMQKARESAGGDREKMREAMQAAAEEAGKEIDKASSSLKPEQTKRLKQIQLQVAGLRAFTEADVQKELKLTDKQTAEIKDINENLTKDMRDMFSGGAGGDRAKMMEKMQELRKEALDKAAGLLTDEQKATWKTMVGEKFELKMEGGFGGGGGKGKGKRQKAD